MIRFPHFNIVLVYPEIPPNTGNIGRTCVATGSSLHLVKPLGFQITDRALRRAGLDYWKELDFHIHDSLEEFLALTQGHPVAFCTKKAGKVYSEYSFSEQQFIVFGSESLGLPEDLIQQRRKDCITIPMRPDSMIRSLNLANAVSVILYEAVRQCSSGFQQLDRKEFPLNEGN